MSLFLLLPLFFISSFVLTMVGLGGGLIFAPLLILLNFPISTAVSASLFLNGIAAVSASYNYYRKRMVDFTIALPLIVSSSLAAPLGALTTDHVNIRVFYGVLCAVVLFAAVRMFFSNPTERVSDQISRTRKMLGGSLIGLGIGFMGGMLGIGGGVFIVPLLIYIIQIRAKMAAATSMFIVVFSSFSGFFTHVSIAKPDWGFILLAAVFSFAGGQLGSRVMIEKLKSANIRKLFAIVLFVFVLKLIQRFISLL